MNWITMLTLLLILVLCTYLVFARCYKTGFLGALGLGLLAFATGVILLGIDQYRLLPEVQVAMLGIAIFLVQMVTRVIYHETRERHERESRRLL